MGVGDSIDVSTTLTMEFNAGIAEQPALVEADGYLVLAAGPRRSMSYILGSLTSVMRFTAEC